MASPRRQARQPQSTVPRSDELSDSACGGRGPSNGRSNVDAVFFLLSASPALPSRRRRKAFCSSRTAGSRPGTSASMSLRRPSTRLSQSKWRSGWRRGRRFRRRSIVWSPARETTWRFRCLSRRKLRRHLDGIPPRSPQGHAAGPQDLRQDEPWPWRRGHTPRLRRSATRVTRRPTRLPVDNTRPVGGRRSRFRMTDALNRHSLVGAILTDRAREISKLPGDGGGHRRRPVAGCRTTTTADGWPI